MEVGVAHEPLLGIRKTSANTLLAVPRISSFAYNPRRGACPFISGVGIGQNTVAVPVFPGNNPNPGVDRAHGRDPGKLTWEMHPLAGVCQYAAFARMGAIIQATKNEIQHSRIEVRFIRCLPM
jgi:hypothetical protein